MNNLDNMRMRAIFANNNSQHNRMIEYKRKSLHRALLYSYQSAWIRKDNEDAEQCRALINPDKIKFDYDEKIISVDFRNNFKAGDTFEWPLNSNIHWISYSQELTELAYFRGNVRRCQEIEAQDPDTKEWKKIYGAVRGPVETKINSIQKAGIVADVPNLSLDIYIPLTEENRKLFNRYCRFSFDGRMWMVQAPDSISTPGILEIVAEEDYNCEHDNLIEKIENPNPPVEGDKVPQISGETFIKPLQKETYISNVISPEYNWSINLDSKNKDIQDVLTWSIDSNKITVQWTAMVSGSFAIHYGPLTKNIVVESLF